MNENQYCIGSVSTMTMPVQFFVKTPERNLWKDIILDCTVFTSAYDAYECAAILRRQFPSRYIFVMYCVSEAH